MLRGKAIDDTEYYDDGASRKYDLQREERISEELREASEDVRRVRNRKRKPFDGAEGEEPQVAENEVPVVKKCREDLAVQRMLEEETRKAEELKSGDFMDAIFRCPLCFIPMKSSTSDEGKTKWWCPAKCLLPWTTDEKKPVLYSESWISTRIRIQYLTANCTASCASWKWSERINARMNAWSISCSSPVLGRKRTIGAPSLCQQSSMARKARPFL